MDVLRTPDERFAGLPGWPFAPRHLDQAADGAALTLRRHYIDEGPRDAPATVLCLHGQPTWSYLYRKMIPVFTAAGLRVVAPDYFGRSDKPAEQGWYSFDRHRDALIDFIERLDLRNVLLEAAAYDAPFPDATYKAGVRAFPNLVPDSERAPGAALSRAAGVFWTDAWKGDAFMAIGMQDPVLGAAPMRALAKRIRGCTPPLEVAEAGHFVQEWGEPIAAAALAHFGLHATAQ